MQVAPLLISVTLYLSSFIVLLAAIKKKSPTPNTFKYCLGLATLSHAVVLQLSLFSGSQLNLSLLNAANMIFFAISVISWFAIMRKMPIENLLIALFPLTTVTLILSGLIAENELKTIQGEGLISHILLSILAYSFITIAALQACLLAIQEKQLRQHNFNGLFQYFPPLQTMEDLLFEMIWLGFITLTAAIATGALFLHDIFAQHLVHKTILSIIAWGVFAILILGRHLQGWRGTTATKLTLAGFTALMLAYFGSKFVLEVLLQKSWQV